MRRIIAICKEVPLLPIAIIAAVPLALLGSWRPWEAAGVSLTFGPFNPGVGQWIVIALVVYTIVVTVIGMIDDLRHGHVGVDLLRYCDRVGRWRCRNTGLRGPWC